MDLRKVERMLYRCPEVDPGDYERFPPVDEYELMWMEADYRGHLSSPHLSFCQNPR